MTASLPRLSGVTAGGALQLFNSVCNLGPLSNAFAIWLSISPADLFLYIFLPPLLLDSAVRMEWFIFQKVPVVPQIAHMAPVGWLRGEYDAVQCMLTARSWAAVQVMLQVFTFAFLVVIGCVIIMTPVMLYVFRLVVRSCPVACLQVSLSCLPHNRTL
jgi:hypothetical protein